MVAEQRRKGQRGQREAGRFSLFWFRSGRGCGCAPGLPRLRGDRPLCGRASCASGAPSGPCGGGGGSGGLAGLGSREEGEEEKKEEEEVEAQAAERQEGEKQEQKTGRTFH